MGLAKTRTGTLSRGCHPGHPAIGETGLPENESMRLRRRVYQADQDLERVVALLARSWTSSGPFTLWHIGDLSWWERCDWGKGSFLWEDDRGDLVAFEDSDRSGDYALLLVPDLVGTAAHEQLIAEMEVLPLEPPSDLSPLQGHRTFVPEDRPALAAFLEQQGYARTAYFKAQFLRSLAIPIGAAALPDGYRIRPLVGEEEIEARVALHQACFGAVTPERDRRVMGLCTYRCDLDLLATASDGSLAASCLIWLDAHNRVGQIESIGTHPRHRRRGLGRAVILEGLRRIQSLGATTAYVRPDEATADLVGFYVACGFRIGRRDYLYLKAPPPRSISAPTD
jgi:mycothiol synthase